LDIEPTAAFDYSEETIGISSDKPLLQDEVNIDLQDNKNIKLISKNIVAYDEYFENDSISGFEPVLGGQLREKAIWVDEATCIGCQYCVHVATNTFIVDERLGRSRVIRQNGDNLEIVQEAIDTCPVDCIHWVDFEDLDKLDASLNRDMFQSLGKLPRVNRH
tara:strand:- start:571 stop:1056 length:486 start_codon:yes stop_codon:yes gene_type:complete